MNPVSDGRTMIADNHGGLASVCPFLHRVDDAGADIDGEEASRFRQLWLIHLLLLSKAKLKKSRHVDGTLDSTHHVA